MIVATMKESAAKVRKRWFVLCLVAGWFAADDEDGAPDDGDFLFLA